MIEIGLIAGDDYSAILVSGHSESATLCNAVSMLMKQFEIACKHYTENPKFIYDKPGNFKVYYRKNQIIEKFEIVIAESFEWLKLKHKKEISIRKENSNGS